MKPSLLSPRIPILPVLPLLGGFLCALPTPVSAEEKSPEASAAASRQVASALTAAISSAVGKAVQSPGITVSNGSITVSAQSTNAAESGSASVSVSQNAEGSLSITTVGPDGKPNTIVRSFSFPGRGEVRGKGFVGAGADGKPPALSVHKRPEHLEKVPFIGVSVEEAPHILGKHLSVPPGIGLVVYEVLKDSPAEKAGFQKDDVLVRFEDQWMVNVPQLRTLTRTKKTGETVRLSVIRKGKETPLEVQIGEREEEIAGGGKGDGQGHWGKEGLQEWISHAREKWLSPENAREMWENFRNLMRENGKNPPFDRPPHPLPPAGEHRDFERELDKMEEEIGRLRSELHRHQRENRENPEKRDFRNRGTNPEGHPDRREGHGDSGGADRRGAGRGPGQPPPPPPGRPGVVEPQPAPAPAPRPPERP